MLVGVFMGGDVVGVLCLLGGFVAVCECVVCMGYVVVVCGGWWGVFGVLLVCMWW